MKRVVKVAISLPEDLLGQVDKVCRARGESRSQYFREAAASRLKLGTESSADVYRRGYAAVPETAAEVEAATYSAIALLASEPWE
ncbi:MAG: CopG family ribbon-helix-helix protein [Candidatus Dormibacteria bacterium]